MNFQDNEQRQILNSIKKLQFCKFWMFYKICKQKNHQSTPK